MTANRFARETSPRCHQRTDQFRPVRLVSGREVKSPQANGICERFHQVIAGSGATVWMVPYDTDRLGGDCRNFELRFDAGLCAGQCSQEPRTREPDFESGAAERSFIDREMIMCRPTVSPADLARS